MSGECDRCNSHAVECECEEWMNAPMGKPINKKDIMRETDCQNCGGCGESGCCKGCPECNTDPAIESLKIRVELLEEELDKLTNVVRLMSDHLIKINTAANEFKMVED